MNIYDFDGTLYNGDSTVDFLLFSLRKRPSLLRFIPGQSLAVAAYLAGRIDKTAMKERLYKVFTGYDAQGLTEEFWIVYRCKIFPWYSRQHRENDIVISASPEFLLKPICQQLGIGHLLASRVDARTGKYEGQNCWGTEKVKRLEKELGITRCEEFYSDSRSDQSMADIAERAFLVVRGRIREWKK